MDPAAPRRALVTGITGQDGSYLAEFLLEQGYDVVGMVRRTSTVTFDRIAHIQDRVTLVQADLLDEVSLIHLLSEHRPAEVYNLAAQSFVPTSWVQPVFTGEATALGVTRMLDAIRIVDPTIRFYQASSSEMFGKVQEVPQRETTPFYPRSPYGVAKVYGHWITVNYRESYGMFAVSGILFNHECISEHTPLVLRRGCTIEVARPIDFLTLERQGPGTQHFDVPGLEVWDGRDWTQVTAITATRRRATDPDHTLRLVQARGGIVEVTAHHRMIARSQAESVAVANGHGVSAPKIDAYQIVPARAVRPGDELAIAERLPAPPGWTVLTAELAELLGLLTADGYVAVEKKIVFTNNDPELRRRVANLWHRLFMGEARESIGQSGWNPEREVHQLSLTGGNTLRRWLRGQLYTSDGFKRVPPLVLNASLALQRAYLDGHYAGDGLKRGKGLSVKTNSAVLAQGLAWLYANQGQLSSVYAEQRGGRTYFQLNIPSAGGFGRTGQHLRGDPAEVRRVDAVEAPEEWLFDLETESGVFMAGVGRVVVHNSPRRGLEFVTHKVTDAAARIALGLAHELRLGNLDSRRDWGWAPDYVRAMWRMLQADGPDDYVVATGETHSVAEFCEAAFDHVDLDWREHVVQDERFMRPAEVDLLVGDASKARDALGWAPRVPFEEMVRRMVDADLEKLAREREQA